jgi:hypothetical protein
MLRGAGPRARFMGTLGVMAAALLMAFAAVGAISTLGVARGALAESDSISNSSGKIRIAFVGDSTADGYWEGVSVTAGRDACLKNQLEFGRFAKNSTGLTRPDRFDWVMELRRVADGFKPKLFVMSLGLNDRQSVVEHGQITMDDSPLYDDKYKERVTGVLKNAAAAKTALLWIGLPAMRAPATDKDTRAKNRLFEEAIAAFGGPDIEYVEPWKLSPAGADTFASYGPDPNGRMVQIRTPDGEHFTVAGEMLAAAYLLPRIVASVTRIAAQDGVSLCAKNEVQSQ